MLRNPEFGNVWRLTPDTTFHRNMSGELLSGQVHPMLESFTVIIKALTVDQINAFINFAIGTSGRQVSLIDFEGNHWTGVITDHDLKIVRKRRSADCQWQIGFSFEGTRS